MDIDARLEAARTDSKTSRPALDVLYYEALDVFQDDPEHFNAFVQRLKAVCLDKAIDHSKYKLREPPQAVTPAAEVGAPREATRRRTPEARAPQSSVPIKRILEICRTQASFLGYAIVRLRSAEGLPEKLAVVASCSVSDEWISRTFVPDFYQEFPAFIPASLDARHAWVILFLFHCTDTQVLEGLKRFIDENSPLEFFDVRDFENNEPENRCWKANRQHIFNGTVPTKPRFLVHDLPDSEQECLIKEFFGSDAGFLVCSDLKGGLSGARALLVTPKAGPGDLRKFVVKVCRKSESKLRDEFDRFKNFVEPHWTPGQYMVAEFKDTARYEALRYPFASEDTIRDSISFGEKYGDTPGVESLQNIIKNVFEHHLLVKWRERTRSDLMSVVDAFSSLLDPDKSKQALKAILSPDFSMSPDLNEGQLASLLLAKVEFLRCPNHGDLHSDNIRVQAETHAVFLIDFGMTGMYPAGLDYATLEASIRFKLLDHSIDLRILLPLDADPMDKFDNLIRPGESVSGVGEKANKLCSMIRQQFLNDFSGKGKSLDDLKAQYLCCLLVLCLRQIRFADLNRRYILQLMSQIIPPLHTYYCETSA